MRIRIVFAFLALALTGCHPQLFEMAHPSASVEIVGVRLIDKDHVSVETEIRNISKEAVNLDPYIWVQTSTLNGKRMSNEPSPQASGRFRITLSIYAVLSQIYPVRGGMEGLKAYFPPAFGRTLQAR
jgi:hypothetical protein